MISSCWRAASSVFLASSSEMLAICTLASPLTKKQQPQDSVRKPHRQTQGEWFLCALYQEKHLYYKTRAGVGVLYKQRGHKKKERRAPTCSTVKRRAASSGSSCPEKEPDPPPPPKLSGSAGGPAPLAKAASPEKTRQPGSLQDSARRCHANMKVRLAQTCFPPTNKSPSPTGTPAEPALEMKSHRAQNHSLGHFRPIFRATTHFTRSSEHRVRFIDLVRC